MLVDTGADTACIRPYFSLYAKLRSLNRNGTLHVFDTTATASLFEESTWTIGSTPLGDAYVWELKSLVTPFVNGLIGMNIFGKFHEIGIDYRNAALLVS